MKNDAKNARGLGREKVTASIVSIFAWLDFGTSLLPKSLAQATIPSDQIYLACVLKETI